MQCKQACQQIAGLSEPARATLALTQHLSRCNSCRRIFEERKVLHAAVARLRAETVGVGPSDSVEERLRAELNFPVLKVRRTATTVWWAVVSATVVAAVCIASLVARRSTEALPAQSAAVPVNGRFTAMPYVIPPAPYERTTVIRTEVSLQIMLAAGFQVHGGDLGSSTLADVLYGEDGRILAIRLVPQPDSFSDERMN
jgi:hypothetical protein